MLFSQGILVILNQELYVSCFYTLAKVICFFLAFFIEKIRIFSPNHCSGCHSVHECSLTIQSYFKII